MLLCTAEHMRAMDRYTIDTIGVLGRVLMEVAGRSVADAMVEGLGSVGGKQILVLAGPGNNGGDGFVAARHLCNRGAVVTVALLADENRLKGDAKTNFDILQHFDVKVEFVKNEGQLRTLMSGRWDGVVDAMLGTGLTKPVKGLFAVAVELANNLDAFKVAVDIPTGVDSDSGAVLGIAFKADITPTFGMAKLGQFSYPGKAYCGLVRVVDIGIPKQAIEHAGTDGFVPEAWDVAGFFDDRPVDAFKNQFGHLLIIGGTSGKGGSVLLAGMSALKSGAGLVTVATDVRNQAHAEGKYPDLMIEALYKIKNDNLELDEEAFVRLTENKTAIAIGPGLGVSEGSAHLIEKVIKTELPVVFDADALNTMAGHRYLLDLLNERHVITPHPGEAARLLQIQGKEVQNNRIRAVRELLELTGSNVVLKGAGTLILGPDSDLVINPTGTPAMAKAGSGDSLTGIIGALLARGIGAFDSAWVGVYVHGLAGELAEEELGQYGVTASDIVEFVPDAIEGLREEVGFVRDN